MCITHGITCMPFHVIIGVNEILIISKTVLRQLEKTEETLETKNEGVNLNTLDKHQIYCTKRKRN